MSFRALRINPTRLARAVMASTFVAAALSSAALPARAQGASTDLSAASALSVAVPVAVSVAAPVLLVSGTVTLTVLSVAATVEGVVWVVERASEGARTSIRWTSEGLAAGSMVVGSVIVVTAVSTGWLVSQTGKVIAFIPNEIGASLTYQERITERGLR